MDSHEEFLKAVYESQYNIMTYFSLYKQQILPLQPKPTEDPIWLAPLIVVVYSNLPDLEMPHFWTESIQFPIEYQLKLRRKKQFRIYRKSL